jgi:hypothetical protein
MWCTLMPTPSPARAPKDRPKFRKKGLTAHRWSVGFNEQDGPRVVALAGNIPVGIWIRSVVLEHMKRKDKG